MQDIELIEWKYYKRITKPVRSINSK